MQSTRKDHVLKLVSLLRIKIEMNVSSIKYEPKHFINIQWNCYNPA